MKYFKISATLCMVVILCFSLGGCKKSAPAGPEGPQGEQGPAGPQGDQGSKGDVGDDGGISNVMYSDWVTPEFKYPVNGTFARGTIDEPEITQAILDSGSVVIYCKNMATDKSVYKLDYYTDTSSITQRISKGTLWVYVSYDPVGLLFRYIIIPHGMNVDANARRPFRLPDYNNYRAVCRYYGIKE